MTEIVFRMMEKRSKSDCPSLRSNHSCFSQLLQSILILDEKFQINLRERHLNTTTLPSNLTEAFIIHALF
jgi:hypothetical protein